MMADGGWRIADGRGVNPLLFAAMLLVGLVHPPSAIANPPSSDPAHQQFLFAYKLLQRGEDRLAGEAFDEFLRDYPSAKTRGDALYYRAMLHRRAGESDKTIAQLKDAPAPTLVPGYAVHLLRGQALADLDRHK